MSGQSHQSHLPASESSIPLKGKKPTSNTKTCLFEGGVEGLQSVLQTRGSSVPTWRGRGKRGLGKSALLTPPGSAGGSPSQAAQHGSQQLLVTDADGRGSRAAFSYGLCRAPSCCPFCQPSTRLFHDGASSSHGGQEESRLCSSSSSLLSPWLQQDGRCITSQHPSVPAPSCRTTAWPRSPCHRCSGPPLRQVIPAPANVASSFAGLAVTPVALPGRLTEGKG